MTIAISRRLAVAGALAVAAVAAPVLTALATSVSPEVSATAKCLAWLGSRDDGQCIGYSSGSPTNIGTPNGGIYGPNGGITSGPLIPGQTFNQGITP